MSAEELRGVVLAGGTGSRLFPLTKVTNKHLLPVGREPMIFHPLRKLVEAGIREVLIVTGPDHMGDVVSLLGSGRDFGCELTYRVQDEAGGIAQALGLARRFARGGRLAEGEQHEHVRREEEQRNQCEPHGVGRATDRAPDRVEEVSGHRAGVARRGRQG